MKVGSRASDRTRFRPEQRGRGSHATVVAVVLPRQNDIGDNANGPASAVAAKLGEPRAKILVQLQSTAQRPARGWFSGWLHGSPCSCSILAAGGQTPGRVVHAARNSGRGRSSSWTGAPAAAQRHVARWTIRNASFVPYAHGPHVGLCTASAPRGRILYAPQAATDGAPIAGMVLRRPDLLRGSNRFAAAWPGVSPIAVSDRAPSLVAERDAPKPAPILHRYMSPNRGAAALLLLMALAFPAPAAAQSTTTGALEGTVRSGAGVAIPDVQVTVRPLRSGLARVEGVVQRPGRLAKRTTIVCGKAG